jgi:hypothetical protein
MIDCSTGTSRVAIIMMAARLLVALPDARCAILRAD